MSSYGRNNSRVSIAVRDKSSMGKVERGVASTTEFDERVKPAPLGSVLYVYVEARCCRRASEHAPTQSEWRPESREAGRWPF